MFVLHIPTDLEYPVKQEVQKNIVQFGFYNLCKKREHAIF